MPNVKSEYIKKRWSFEFFRSVSLKSLMTYKHYHFICRHIPRWIRMSHLEKKNCNEFSTQWSLITDLHVLFINSIFLIKKAVGISVYSISLTCTGLVTGAAREWRHAQTEESILPAWPREIGRALSFTIDRHLLDRLIRLHKPLFDKWIVDAD